MKKLFTALKVGGYYDDELVELNSSYDQLLEECEALRRRYTLRPPRQNAEEEESNAGDAAGRWPQMEGADPAFDPGHFPDRSHLVEIMQRLVLPPAMPPMELLAETARQEVLEASKPRHTLEASRLQLLAFFQRRRGRLALQCELISSRLRCARQWSQLRKRAPEIQQRLRLLCREIEAADVRITRLGERPVRMRKDEVKGPGRPIAQSCTKKKLFDYNEVYREMPSTRVFRSDIVVCLRELVWGDRSTRMLRRFLLQARHLSVTHRGELWRCSLQLARKGLEEGARVPLWESRMVLEKKLMAMARSLGIPGLLEQDSGHTLASNVTKMFPDLMAKQEQELAFAAYPQLQVAGAKAAPGSQVHLLVDDWLDCIPLQPRVSLRAAEQRAVMLGRLEGPMAIDPGTGLAECLKKELDFLAADVRTAEARLRSLAEEGAARPPLACRSSEEDEEVEGMPQYLLQTFLLTRHLNARRSHRELLGLLNLFRYIQQKLSHGVLMLQSSAAGQPKEPQQPREKPLQEPLLVGQLPPSYPLAFPLACRGFTGPQLGEALQRLSEAEYTLPGPEHLEEVVDGNGLKVVHSSAVSDLERVEQELLIVASYALQKSPPSTQSRVDTAGLLAEVRECEVALCRAKWRLVRLQFSIFERATLAKWDVAQRIVDVLALRPCFDLATGSFRDGYDALIGALEEREALQRTLVDYQLQAEALQLRKLKRSCEATRRCARRLELDLGHQRERKSKAKQPTPLAGPEIEEDPQLCVEDMLAHPLEGLPEMLDHLDFSDSLALTCELDALIEGSIPRELAPEVCFEHHWERAACRLLAKEWREHVAQAALWPGVPTSIGIKGLSDEAQASPIFWGDLAEDPNWLLLQAQEVILQWKGEEFKGPGPCREKDPELAWVPLNEAILRLSCRLLDQVRMRRQLLDTLCEVKAIEVGLAHQAQLVGTIENLRISETLNDLSSEFDVPASSKGPAPLLAAEALLSLGHLDLSSASGVRRLLEVDHMHELHTVVQHQVAGKWLLVGCLLYNNLLSNGLLRRQVDDFARGRSMTCAGRPWPPEEELEEPWPKVTAKSLQWPGSVRTAVYTQVGASVREAVRGYGRQIEMLPTEAAKVSCLVIYRCRSLAFSSLFLLERGCDLLLRLQAAETCVRFRNLVSILPVELSPFKLSAEGRRRMILENDGTVQSIFHIPQMEEALELRGSESPSIGRHVRDSEVSMPEPFTQLAQVEDAHKEMPQDPVIPPIVGSPKAAWAPPSVEISFTGTAAYTMLMLHEMSAITSLALFSASMSGDQLLLLQALHAVEAAWGNKAQRVAAENVLSESEEVQVGCERHPRSRSLNQLTWDALEHVRADVLHLEAMVKGLREGRHQVKPVLQLLRQHHRFLKMGAMVLCKEAWQAAVQKKWLEEAAELQRWAAHLEGFPLEGGCRLAVAAGAMEEMVGRPQQEFPSLTDVMAGNEPPKAELTAFEASADQALERLWMSCRAPPLAGDEIDQAEANGRPRFQPEHCSHLHPLFHALCLYFARPGRTPFAEGEEPSFVPMSNGPSSPGAMCRALLMLPGKMRRQVADIHLRQEMECDLIGRGDDLEEAEGLVQTRYAVLRLREMASTFLLLSPPLATPSSLSEAKELLGRELRRRQEMRERELSEEEAEEPGESSESVEQLKAKQVQMVLEMAIKVAGEAAAAAERAAEFEGDWLIMAKGGPGAEGEQEAGRIQVKNSLVDSHDVIVCLVGIIVKCGLRFAAAGIARLKKHMETCLTSEGGIAVSAFAQHLLSRANFVQTFCKDGQNAWIIKHCDLRESLEEMGRRMLEWAIVNNADQVASARERVKERALNAKTAEEELLKARLGLWHQRRDLNCLLNTMVSDRVQREMFELDRLHRSHRAIGAAALEAEHRCNVNLHEEIVQKLASLDHALSYCQSCLKEYRSEMFQGAQLEMQNLKQSLAAHLQKMPQSLTLQNALRRIEKEGVERGEEPQALKPAEPVQPESAATVFQSTAPLETYVEAEILGPGEPCLVPGAQLQRKAALEEMHLEKAQLLAAGTRIHAFFDLKCQQLRQYYDEELHRLSSALSSNRQVWENVSEGRARQQLLGEELRRSVRRCDDAVGDARHMQKAMEEHEEYTKKMFNWKRRMLKAQGDLQHEMRKYERDGLVDVSKMESELGKLQAQLQQLSTAVPAEQLVELIARRHRRQVLDMQRTMRHERRLLNKAGAKVQVIRAELEKGAQDQEDEPFAELLMEECERLSGQLAGLDVENKELREKLLRTGDVDIMVYQPRAEQQAPVGRVPEIFRDTSFEQELCFSVSFMKPPRGKTRKQIDQTHGGALPTFETEASSTPRTPRRAPQAPRFV